MEWKNKDDYTCTAYLGSRKVNAMRFVHDVQSYALWLNRQGVEWSVLNVYNRRSRQFITRFYRGQSIISKPR